MNRLRFITLFVTGLTLTFILTGCSLIESFTNKYSCKVIEEEYESNVDFRLGVILDDVVNIDKPSLNIQDSLVTKDNGIMVVGYEQKEVKGKDRVYGKVIKYNQVGNIIFENSYILSCLNEFSSILEVEDGYLVSGYVTFEDKLYAPIIMKYDLEGKQDWVKIYESYPSTRKDLDVNSGDPYTTLEKVNDNEYILTYPNLILLINQHGKVIEDNELDTSLGDTFKTLYTEEGLITFNLLNEDVIVSVYDEKLKQINEFSIKDKFYENTHFVGVKDVAKVNNEYVLLLNVGSGTMVDFILTLDDNFDVIHNEMLDITSDHIVNYENRDTLLISTSGNYSILSEEGQLIDLNDFYIQSLSDVNQMSNTKEIIYKNKFLYLFDKNMGITVIPYQDKVGSYRLHHFNPLFVRLNETISTDDLLKGLYLTDDNGSKVDANISVLNYNNEVFNGNINYQIDIGEESYQISRALVSFRESFVFGQLRNSILKNYTFIEGSTKYLVNRHEYIAYNEAMEEIDRKSFNSMIARNVEIADQMIYSFERYTDTIYMESIDGNIENRIYLSQDSEITLIDIQGYNNKLYVLAKETDDFNQSSLVLIEILKNGWINEKKVLNIDYKNLANIKMNIENHILTLIGSRKDDNEVYHGLVLKYNLDTNEKLDEKTFELNTFAFVQKIIEDENSTFILMNSFNEFKDQKQGKVIELRNGQIINEYTSDSIINDMIMFDGSLTFVSPNNGTIMIHLLDEDFNIQKTYTSNHGQYHGEYLTTDNNSTLYMNTGNSFTEVNN